MNTQNYMIERLSVTIKPDPRRVILQFFELNKTRTERVIQKICALDENETGNMLQKVFVDFSNRHHFIEQILFSNYRRVEKHIANHSKLSNNRKLLIGSYFSKEYSTGSAALFNPSIVVHPDQSEIDNGSLRFILSLRAVGEGHISSIEFREGIIDEDSNINLMQASRFATLPERSRSETKATKKRYKNISSEEIRDLTDSNYVCSFSSEIPLNERVLFPFSKSECMGMEDARFVKFSENNSSRYLGTYTAYNGRSFRTQILETNDFKNFIISKLSGNAVKDKGMAIFPRKINNKYVITSRQDGENMFIMDSDDIYRWNKPRLIRIPEHPWEFIQLGNCGSPIETEAGWILITHAVGPMRAYVISALLLDLDNPSIIIGSLKKPLIEPNEAEREGYVPNVVYSCGSIIHKENLIIPYAFSDSSCGFAKVNVAALIKKLTESKS